MVKAEGKGLNHKSFLLATNRMPSCNLAELLFSGFQVPGSCLRCLVCSTEKGSWGYFVQDVQEALRPSL